MSLHPELDDLKRDGGILSWSSWVRQMGDALSAWIRDNPTPTNVVLYRHDIQFTGWQSYPEQYAIMAWWVAFRVGESRGVAVACVPLHAPQPNPQPINEGDVMEHFGGVPQRTLLTAGRNDYLTRCQTRAFDRLVEHLQEEERSAR